MYARDVRKFRSKGLAIHKAVVQFVGNIDRAGRESGVNGVLDGADEATLCREFLLRRMFDGFSRTDLEGLRAALHSPNGTRLLAAYADARNLVAGRDIPDGVRNTVGSTASMLRLQLFELNATLCRHLGIEEDVPAPFDGPVPRLSAFGAAGLDDDLVRLARERNAAAAREAVDSRVRGNSPAAERLRGVFAAKLGPEPADPESTIRDDMQSVARSILTRSVLIDMKNFATGRPTQFDRDRGRQFKATLAGVGELSTDPAVARDQFAKFVTKNPAATYSSLDARSRNKAHLVMAIVSQGAHDAVFHGFGVSLDPQMSESAVSFTGGGAAERSFAIEMDENGGINVRFNSRQKPDMMLVGLEPVQCSPNSSVTMGLNVYFDAQELDRIGNVDFAAYDDEPIRQIIDVQHPANRFRVARFAIPDAFRVRMEVGARVVAEL